MSAPSTWQVARPGPRRRRYLLRVALAFAGALLALMATHRVWLPLLGAYLVVGDPLRAADAVVALAGEPSRITHAADLLTRGQAQWFVATDMWLGSAEPPGRYAALVAGEAASGGVPPARILQAPGTVRTTYEEALSLRALASAQGWRSLIVVTSPFHTRRARLILREVFEDTGVAVSVQPVPEHWYAGESWWRSALGRHATMSEYAKLALYLLGYERGRAWEVDA